MFFIGGVGIGQTRPQSRKWPVHPAFAHKNKGCGLAAFMAAQARKMAPEGRKNGHVVRDSEDGYSRATAPLGAGSSYPVGSECDRSTKIMRFSSMMPRQIT